MTTYIKAKNPDVAQSVIDMIPLYLSEGKAEGVRGDIAFAQSCLETGNFGFSGSAVTLDQNNFCGMGVAGGNPGTGAEIVTAGGVCLRLCVYLDVYQFIRIAAIPLVGTLGSLSAKKSVRMSISVWPAEQRGIVCSTAHRFALAADRRKDCRQSLQESLPGELCVGSVPVHLQYRARTESPLCDNPIFPLL